MLQGLTRGAPLGTVAPRNVISSPARDTRTSTAALPDLQAAFVAARFGLDATRAKLTAELCWRRS